MSDLKLNSTSWDLEIENGDLVIVDHSQAVGQNLRQALSLFFGEWFLDTSAGVPYYQSILLKNPDPASIDGVLKNAILSVKGVDELLSFDLMYESTTRELRVEYSVRVSDEVLDFVNILGQVSGA
jgi:hypothetical protein